MGIYQKLLELQANVKVDKDQTNTFSQSKYKYRNLASINQKIIPIAHKLGLFVSYDDESVIIDGWHYVKATITAVDTETGESVSKHAYARECEIKKGSDPAQITGAASSYARKYAADALLSLDGVADPDSMDNSESGAATAGLAETPDVRKKLYGEIAELCKKLGVTSKKLRELYGINVKSTNKELELARRQLKKELETREKEAD